MDQQRAKGRDGLDDAGGPRGPQARGAPQHRAADVTTYPALLAKAGERVSEATAQNVGDAAEEAKQQLVEMPQRVADVVAQKPAGGKAARAAGETARPAASEEAHPH